MELRDIEIFLTLANELHFGRTAERLHVSQARVSQAIKQQERRIGAALFERTSRKVALTPVGEQLYVDLEVGYQRIVKAVERATAVARGQRGRLVLGIIGPLVHEISPVIDVFRARHDDCELVVREILFTDPFGPLRTGDVDVALVWLPVREPGLTVGPVMVTDPLVIAASVRHPLATRARVCIDDLGEYPVMQSAHPIPQYWEEAPQPRTTPSGRQIVRGPTVGTWNEIMAALAIGEAVCIVGADAIKYHARPDIVYLPLEDGATRESALVWRSDADHPLVRAFVDIARAHEPVDLAYLTEAGNHLSRR